MILFLFFLLSFSTASVPLWSACFLSSDSHELVQKLFYRPDAPSDAVVFSDHLTLCYDQHCDGSVHNVSGTERRTERHITAGDVQWGRNVVLQPLVRISDENGQAVLTRIVNYQQRVGSPRIHHAMWSPIVSLNNFTHITISTSGVEPYDANYSNQLIMRVVQMGVLDIERDQLNQVKKATLKEGLDEWKGELPDFEFLGVNYPKTNVLVIPYQPVQPNEKYLKAVVCLSSMWNSKTRTCDHN